MITWSKVMSPNGCIWFLLPTKFGLHVFFETLTWGFRNLVIQGQAAIENETESSYQKVITKLLQSYYKVITKLLQSYYKVITKCDRSLLQSASGITKCDRLLLQSALAITKCASYYRMRRNSVTIIFEGFHDFLNYLAKNFWSFLNSPHLITQQCIGIAM